MKTMMGGDGGWGCYAMLALNEKTRKTMTGVSSWEWLWGFSHPGHPPPNHVNTPSTQKYECQTSLNTIHLKPLPECGPDPGQPAMVATATAAVHTFPLPAILSATVHARPPAAAAEPRDPLDRTLDSAVC